jgi:hypothetical protein
LKQKGEEFGGRLRDAFNNLKGNVIVEGLTPEQNNPNSIASQRKDTPTTANTSVTSESKKALTESGQGNKVMNNALAARDAGYVQPAETEIANHENAPQVTGPVDEITVYGTRPAADNTAFGPLRDGYLNAASYYHAPRKDDRTPGKYVGDLLSVPHANYFTSQMNRAAANMNSSTSLLGKGANFALGVVLAAPSLVETLGNGVLNSPAAFAYAADATGEDVAKLSLARTPLDKLEASVNLVRDASTAFGTGLGFGMPVAGALESGLAGRATNSVRSTSGAAGDLQGFTFRGDTRGPDVIFNEGFAARGNSEDLFLHALDNTSPPSAYIPTSTSYGVASDFAENVYVVRPRNGIDVNAVLGSKSPFPSELEIAIPYRIDTKDIRAVTLRHDGVSILNPNYKK